MFNKANDSISSTSAEKKYFFKILVLILSSCLGYFSIWWTLVREESVDWISGHIVHQPWPYAVTENSDGLLVNNVIEGFELYFPVNWKSDKKKNPRFFVAGVDGKVLCEVAVSFNAGVDNREKEVIPENYIKNKFGQTEAMSDKQGMVYYIKLKDKLMITEFNGDKNFCSRDFSKIKDSFVYYRDQEKQDTDGG